MEIVFAGFGGQGVLTSGLVTAYIALKNDLEVLWSPAYGGQMRGGKAYSMVKYDSKPITEPIISKLDLLVAMNTPSLDFMKDLKPEGTLIVNSNVVRDDVELPAFKRVVRLPVEKLAEEAGNARSANLVTVGAVVKLSESFDADEACRIMQEFFTNKGKGKFNDANARAFWAGYNAV